MANVVPGVLYRPIDFSGYPRRRKGRGACAHVAVSNSTNLVPSGGNSWHFYLPKVGPAIQYVDLDYVAYCQRDGNSSLVSWESQGGVDNPDGESWTANQVEWGARIYAHLNKTEGSPFQVMPNSLPTSRGLGYHRLGIDPWRISGGELWSSAYGKLCPGAAKIAQIPQIIARARQIVAGTEEDFMATMSDGEKAALMDMVTTFQTGKAGVRSAGPGWLALVNTAAAVGRIESLVRAAAEGAGISQEKIDQIVNGVADKLGAGFDLELQPKTDAAG